MFSGSSLLATQFSYFYHSVPSAGCAMGTGYVSLKSVCKDKTSESFHTIQISSETRKQFANPEQS